MILVKVTHFLNLTGIQYFASWFSELYDIIKAIDGFVDIAYRFEEKESAAKIILLFENEEKLNQWAKSDKHKMQIEKLDSYRTQPWEASRIKFQITEEMIK